MNQRKVWYHGAWIATAAVIIGLLGTGTVNLPSGGSPTPTPTATATASASPTASPTVTPAPGLANVWIDTDGGSCPRHSTASSYVDAEACTSMATALAVASDGDTVGVQPGTYGRQGLSGTTKVVTFLGVGEKPSFGQLVSASQNITFRNMKFEDRNRASGQCSDPPNATVYPCGAHQTFDDVEIDGLQKSDAHGLRAPGDYFTFKNGSIHGVNDYKAMEIGPANSLIDHNVFWDIQNTIPTGNHQECLYYDGGSNTTISRNWFIKCPIMAILFTQYVNGPPYSNITVENNIFGHPETNVGVYGNCALNIGGNANRDFTGWVIRNNTIETCVLGGDSPTDADDGLAEWYNNLGGHISCSASEWVSSYNVGESCGDTGEVSVDNPVNTSSAPNQAPFYLDALGDDLHLKLGTNLAIGAGDPFHFPSIDRDGNARTNPPSAGAYERVS